MMFDTYIAVLPNLKSYIDPAKTVKAMTAHFQKVFLVISDYRDISNYDELCHSVNSKSSFSVLSNKKAMKPSKLGYGKWIAAQIPLTRKMIINESFHLKLAPLLYVYRRNEFRRARRLGSCKVTLSLFSPSIGMMMNRTWHDKKKWPLSLRDQIFYFKMLLKRSVKEALSLHYSDCAICNSEEIKSGIDEYLPWMKKRIAVLPTEIDLGLFNNPCEIKNNFKKKKALSLLVVANCTYWKGLDILIKSLLLINGKLEYSISIVFSHYPTESDVTNFYKYLEYNSMGESVAIKNNLSRNDIAEFYRTHDILIVPSRHEGSPRVLKEGLASRLKVIASDIPGNRLVDPEGKYVSFYDVESHAALARLIVECHKSLSKYDRIRAYEYCQDEFSNDRIALKQFLLFKSIFGC